MKFFLYPLVGSLLMSTWGGPQGRKVPFLIAFIALASTGLMKELLRAQVQIPG